MPNTKVKFKPAFIGGVIAGIMFQIGQWIYIHSQVSMASYNAIYGSFAAIPLFLLWLQTSWYIVMFGAAISNTIQNGLNTEFQNDEIILSHNQKLFFSTWAMRIITKRFEDGEGATDQDTIAHCTGMSIFLTRFILKRLENAELISRIHGKDKDSIQYLPALSTNLLTTYYIENKLDKLYEQKISFSANNEFKKILLIMEERQDALNNSPANKLVTDI
jgi:membrane protein